LPFIAQGAEVAANLVAVILQCVMVVLDVFTTMRKQVVDFKSLPTDELVEMYIEVIRGGFQQEPVFISALKEEIGTRKDDVMRLEE